jgi:hypothetical protein
MISPKWIMYIFFLNMFGILCSALVESAWFGTSGVTTLFSNWSVFTMGDKLSAFGEILTWDYPFFKNYDGTANEFAVIRFGLMAISIAFWFSIIFFALQSVTSWITRIFGGVK